LSDASKKGYNINMFEKFAKMEYNRKIKINYSCQMKIGLYKKS